MGGDYIEGGNTRAYQGKPDLGVVLLRSGRVSTQLQPQAVPDQPEDSRGSRRVTPSCTDSRGSRQYAPFLEAQPQGIQPVVCTPYMASHPQGIQPVVRNTTPQPQGIQPVVYMGAPVVGVVVGNPTYGGNPNYVGDAAGKQTE